MDLMITIQLLPSINVVTRHDILLSFSLHPTNIANVGSHLISITR